MTYLKFLTLVVIASLISCKKDETTTSTTNSQDGPSLLLKFKFDPTQVRLNSFGQPATLPSNHRAQNPQFNEISAHYVELAPTAYTQVGAGAILYKNAETTVGGANAIDFSKSIIVKEGEVFLKIPLKSIPKGTYEYIRVSLAYQNFTINFKAQGLSGTGTLASFVGYNTYLASHKIKDKTIAVNANKKQGFWGFETSYLANPITGQAPDGATTVVNPINSTSPIPAGSCLVTGKFQNTNSANTVLSITGNETSDIPVTLSLSTNQSFEWVENTNDNDYNPADGDVVIDMGTRGLKPIIGK